MPKLVDSKGIHHKHYYTLHRAELAYKKEARAADAKTKVIKRAISDEPIKLTEPKVVKEAIVEAQTYYCLNCGEGVGKGDKVCETCGVTLAWEGIE
jgi:hypothetical protein